MDFFFMLPPQEEEKKARAAFVLSEISVILSLLRQFSLPKGLGANVMNGTSWQFRILTAPSGGGRGLINHLAATQAGASLISQMLLWEALCVFCFVIFLVLESPEVECGEEQPAVLQDTGGLLGPTAFTHCHPGKSVQVTRQLVPREIFAPHMISFHGPF